MKKKKKKKKEIDAIAIGFVKLKDDRHPRCALYRYHGYAKEFFSFTST